MSKRALGPQARTYIIYMSLEAAGMRSVQSDTAPKARARLQGAGMSQRRRAAQIEHKVNTNQQQRTLYYW